MYDWLIFTKARLTPKKIQRDKIHDRPPFLAFPSRSLFILCHAAHWLEILINPRQCLSQRTWKKTEQEVFFLNWRVTVLALAVQDHVFTVGRNHFLKRKVATSFTPHQSCKGGIINRELSQGRRQRQRQKTMIWLVEWGKIIVMHVQYAM